MKIILAISMSAFALSVFGQAKFFIGSDGDYTVLMDQNVVPKSSPAKSGGYVDYYILRQNNDFKFLLSIRKVGLSSSENFIYDEDFRKSFLTECECELHDSKKVSFRNFDGMQFQIKTNMEGRKVSGFTVGVVSSGILFNVIFLTLDSNIDEMLPEYKRITSNLIFR